MSNSIQIINESTQNEFIISRILNAPLEIVWKAWTETEQLKKWWGPIGFKMIIGKLDFNPKGIFQYGMESPDGKTMWGKFVYREIVEFEKIVFVVSFSDENCGITRHPLSELWPLEILSTIIFTELEGKTKLTMHAIPINAKEEEINMFENSFDSMVQGWTGTFQQFEEYLQKI